MTFRNFVIVEKFNTPVYVYTSISLIKWTKSHNSKFVIILTNGSLKLTLTALVMLHIVLYCANAKHYTC